MSAHRGPIVPAEADAQRLPLGQFSARLSRSGGWLWLVLEAGPFAEAPVWRNLATLGVEPGLADELRALANAVAAAGEEAS